MARCTATTFTSQTGAFMNAQSTPSVGFEAWLAERQITEMRHREDLLLVFRCGHRDEPAWREVLECLQQRRGAIEKFSTDPDFASDIVARTLARLSEPRDLGEMRILAYRGTAPLGSWLTAVLVREAIDAVRGQRHHEEIAQDVVDGDSLADSQLAKSQLAPIVHAAMAMALQTLTAKQRTLLHYRFVDKVSIGELATIFGVHRATIARTLAEVNALLNNQIRDSLVRDHNFPKDEVSALVRSVLSQQEGSLESLLKLSSTTMTDHGS